MTDEKVNVPAVVENKPSIYVDHTTALESIRRENELYAVSGDPTLSRVGRINGMFATIMLTFLASVSPEVYDEHAVAFEPVSAEPVRPAE